MDLCQVIADFRDGISWNPGRISVGVALACQLVVVAAAGAGREIGVIDLVLSAGDTASVGGVGVAIAAGDDFGIVRAINLIN